MQKGRESEPVWCIELIMDAHGWNPCSENLVPPIKKHKPRTYVGGSIQLSPGNGTGRHGEETHQHYGSNAILGSADGVPVFNRRRPKKITVTHIDCLG